ncbi:ComEC/Rec2 family competence protein [Streptomyces sp. NEAU-H22]|uniref:ComEC/Rec2 family competence protein n=1 Tax=Streptomyces sp. NEAU-H22 TaxID=2994655 RepID=UPI00224DA27B|nr:ComEC/Rec2 family competence protein [Streptomyces sp. NEAU-H22]MCX3286364.1 ComEC/Rec2 family competence protein [Streptomyces sp. NEAU-H22]
MRSHTGPPARRDETASGLHPARSPVHASSGTRLGTARPRQEGPTDLRLVPPALAAWGTAALLLDASPSWAIGIVTGCLAALGLLPLVRRHRAASWPRASAAALLLCVAAAAASAGLHGADLRRGPVPGLAREYATVTAEVELTSDPRLTRPKVRGGHVAPTAVLIDADVRRVQEADGTTLTTRAPVLMIVDVDTAPRGRVAGGRGRSPWLGLLPSTRLRVGARLAPAVIGGDRVAAVLRVRDQGRPVVVGEPSGPQRLAGRLRAGLREATDGLPADPRALLPGLVVGDTSRITTELEEAFKETDLTHTLAVSGANFTILLALLLGPPGLAQHVERRGLAPRLGISLRGTAVLGGALSLGFVIVCRPEPSVVRAAACGAVALLALATGRRRSMIPALATAVLLLVLYDPWLARSYGFLLSVVATGALLTLAPRWSAGLRRRGVPPRVAEALGAAAAAQALCAPIVAVLSARVSLVAVPCNLLAEFAIAPATVLGFAALAAAPVAMPVAEFLAWCAHWPAGWIARIARTGAALPGGGVDWPGSWAGAALLLAVTLVAVLVGRRLLGHPWWCGACGLLLALVVVQPPPLTRAVTGWPPPGWRLVMCDVGQGDAMVLAAGKGTGVVVDAGPDPRLVDHCLRSLGISRIPLVVLTHFHADHVAGLPGVLRGRAVGAIETTGFEEPAEQAAFVRRLAAARRIPVTRAAAGERRRTGELSWQVVWPPPIPPPGPPSDSPSWTPPGTPPGALPVHPPEPEGPNDASVAMLVRTAGLRLLLLGDLEPPAQRALARSPAAGMLEGVDVLKVAHHGSAYQDPGLIRRAAPRLALISCGENSYGHPAPGTVAALRAGGAAVLRTDRDGALAVAGGGGQLKVARD